MTSTPDAGHVRQPDPVPEGEWTKVRRKSRRIPGPSNRHNVPSSHPHHPPIPIPRTLSLSVSDIEKDYARTREQWTASSCHQQLKALLVSRGSPSPISQAICLGLGSFDPDDGAWEAKRRAHVQLAAFLSITEHLSLRRSGDDDDAGPRPVHCLFQEPLFTVADRAFIRSLGHEVTETPAAFEAVGPGTLVFGVHLYREVYARAIAAHTPAMFVGTPYAVWEEFHHGSDDDLDWVRMRELDAQCDKAAFPEDAGFTTFSSTAIHWRRPDET
ncbi:hypothetical protein F4779DRAFT_276169 [Xylariaceae sp. FL0662B]|nr:hypothetical protein F4779DRAFT_276169 [Xylariaceae sp. FL0662B]